MILGLLQLIKRFFVGVGASHNSVVMPNIKYPFTFPEKALMFDWETIGKDINRAMEKFDEKQ